MNEIEIHGIILDLKTRETATFVKGADEFINSFHLDKEVYYYDVGIDQSNTCTGVGIVSEDVIIILEIANVYHIHFSIYRKVLLRILESVFKDLKLGYTVLEEPLPYISKNQNKELVALKNFLKDNLPNVIKTTKFDTAFPQVWRAGIIKSKDNPHKKTSKEATVWEVLKLYPELREFKSLTFNPTNNKGFDGFEALGIIIGYKSRHNIQDGTYEKILGPKNTTKQALAIFVYEDKNLEKLKLLMTNIRDIMGEIPKLKIYNEEESLYINARMSLTDNFTVTEVTSENYILAQLILMGIEEQDINKKLYMVVLPLNSVKKNLLNFLLDYNYYTEFYY